VTLTAQVCIYWIYYRSIFYRCVRACFNELLYNFCFRSLLL